MRGSPIPDGAVSQQVLRIVASRTFRKCNRLKRLLEFIVDATLKGETNSLKEWVIGTEVYNRGQDFDPRLDPIVRTETRRLRRKLQEYFDTEGREDAVVIEVPKGSYISNFRDRRDDDLFKLPGETIGDYWVLDRLDESLDTVTYRVREDVSNRTHALKVISGAAWAGSDFRSALEAYIAAVAEFKHENVCEVRRLHWSGRNVWIITEYFEGQRIAEFANQSQLTWEQTLQIVRQLVSALSAAHRLGIVHGCLNPGNVHVSQSQTNDEPVVKIMGVGMRSLGEACAGAVSHCEPATGVVDARSDVRSLGGVMRTLLLSSNACSASSDGWRGQVPKQLRPALSAILAKCLSGSAADGYASATELEEALALLGGKQCLPLAGTGKPSHAWKSRWRVWSPRHVIPHMSVHNLPGAALMCVVMLLVAGASRWVSRSNGTGLVRRLAVLPVECPPGDQECRVLGRALIGSLTTRLRHVGRLEVILVDQPSEFTVHTVPALQIAAPLDVDHLLRGTIEKHGIARTFSARIIRASDQAVRSTEQFEWSWSTLADIQAKLMNDVMVLVGPGGPAHSRLREDFAGNSAEERELYATARHAVNTLVTVRERAFFAYAERQLKNALKSNPEFDDARVLLAQLYYQEIWDSAQRAKLLENSRLLLEKAIRRDPERADAYALLGGVFAESGDREQGIEFARRALELAPLKSNPHQELAKLYAEAGFFESALVEEDRALALDPANLAALYSKVLLLSWMGKQVEADLALRTLQEWQPQGIAEGLSADREIRAGNYAAARNLITSTLEHTRNPVNAQASQLALALCSLLMGEPREAKGTFQKNANQPPRLFDHYILLAAQLGDVSHAVDYIRHNPLYFNYRYLVSEPLLAPARRHPVFQALLKQTYIRWQTDLARYGPSLPAPPVALPRPTEASEVAAMASIARRAGHAAIRRN
jgi:tetratricopeptide (TPR) repeat protein/serine/threonine protein kinase